MNRSPLRNYLELVRFSHTVFALPFAAVAALLAFHVPGVDGNQPHFHWRFAVGILLCMVFARSTAMAFNRLVDRDVDAQNPRTQSRHLPAGILTVSSVTAFCVINALGFIASTLLFLPNWLPIALALPVLGWLCGYSYAKRFTAAAHLWLGVALSLSPVCAWIAIRGTGLLQHPADLLPAITLAAAVALWVTGFDIIYACQDAEFDRKAGLHSIPAKLGIAKALHVAALLHGFMLAALFVLPLTHTGLGLRSLYYAGLLVVAALLAYQHYLVTPTDLQRVGIAFFNVNAVISLFLMTLTAIDCYWI